MKPLLGRQYIAIHHYWRFSKGDIAVITAVVSRPGGFYVKAVKAGGDPNDVMFMTFGDIANHFDLVPVSVQGHFDFSESSQALDRGVGCAKWIDRDGNTCGGVGLEESQDRPPVVPLDRLAKYLGVDLPSAPKDVWPEFALWLCDELLKTETSDDVRQAITGVRDLYHQWVQGEWPGQQAFRAAANAAAYAGVSKAAMAARLQDLLRSPQLHLDLEESLGRYEGNDFIRAYIECAMWSSTDSNGDALDIELTINDIAPETINQMVRDCLDFRRKNQDLLRVAVYLNGNNNFSDEALQGHDFWLSRNHHGSGFFDAEFENPEVAEGLQLAAEDFGEYDLDIGGDGVIHGSRERNQIEDQPQQQQLNLEEHMNTSETKLEIEGSTDVAVYDALLKALQQYSDEAPAGAAPKLLRQLIDAGKQAVPRDERAVDILLEVLGAGNPAEVTHALSWRFADLGDDIKPVFGDNEVALWKRGDTLFDSVADLVDWKASGGPVCWSDARGNKVVVS